MEYEIKLSNFSGPLHLLLHLVRKNEIDISGISIARIADEYMKYLQDIRHIDVDKAGDFLALAATLMRMKARLLLPRTGDQPDEEEGLAEDELIVKRLLEYRRYNAVAEVLEHWQDVQQQHYRRGMKEKEVESSIDLGTSLRGVTLLKLALAFKNALGELDDDDSEQPQIIVSESVTVQQQIEFILEHCYRNKEGLLLAQMIKHLPSRIHIVTTFLALLECIRKHYVTVVQEKAFGQVVLLPVKGASSHVSN